MPISIRICTGGGLCIDNWTFRNHTRFIQTCSFTIENKCRFVIEPVLLELQSRHIVIVEEVKLLDGEALHFWNDKEDPGHSDEGKRSPDESLKPRSV
jgi:hypothetical protein